MSIKFWFNLFIFFLIGGCKNLPPTFTFETFLTQRTSQKIDYKALHYLSNGYNISYNDSTPFGRESLTEKEQKTNAIAFESLEKYLFGVLFDYGLDNIPFRKQYFLKNKIKKLVIKTDEGDEVFCREHHVNTTGQIVTIKNYWKESPLSTWEYSYKDYSTKKRSYKEAITNSYHSYHADIEYSFSNSILKKYTKKHLNDEDNLITLQGLLQKTIMGKFIVVEDDASAPQCYLYLDKPFEDIEQLSKQVELIYNQINLSNYRRGMDFDLILLEHGKIIEKLSFTYNGTKQVQQIFTKDLQKTTYIYNKQQIEKEKQVLYWFDREIKVEKTFTYDKEGRLITIVAISPNPNHNTKIVVEYKNAKIVSVKRNYTTVMGGKMSEIVHFEYEYYD